MDKNIAQRFFYELTPEDMPNIATEEAFERDRRGKLCASVDNLVLACRDGRWCGAYLWYDSSTSALKLAPCHDPSAGRLFEDVDYTGIQLRLETLGFAPVGKRALRRAIWLAALENAFADLV